VRSPCIGRKPYLEALLTLTSDSTRRSDDLSAISVVSTGITQGDGEIPEASSALVRGPALGAGI